MRTPFEVVVVLDFEFDDVVDGVELVVALSLPPLDVASTPDRTLQSTLPDTGYTPAW